MLNLFSSLHSAVSKMKHLEMMDCEGGLVMRELHRVRQAP
jgi:hypothetical protein